MKTYITNQIRNVVLLGHGGSGKTSLAEAMAYVSKTTTKLGKVEEKNTISDFDNEEKQRGFSIETSLIPIEFQGCKINVLDTPGFFDFVGEVEEAVSVADAAIIVVSGKNGIEVGTEKAWDMCEKHNLPRMFFVTDMDIDSVSYRQVVQDLNDKFGKRIAPFYMPMRENQKFVGYINVVKKAGRKFTGLGTREECTIPNYSMKNLIILRDVLLEAVAETSDDYMERFFSGEDFSVAEIQASLATNIDNCNIVPVIMGSGTLALNVESLLKDIIKYFPSPNEVKCAGIDVKTNEIFDANHDFSKPKTAFIFKTVSDPFIGKYSFFKVRSGVIKANDAFYNNKKDCEEKPNKIYTMIGNKPIEVEEVHAGDIGAFSKLELTQTGDTLSTKENVVYYPWVDFPKPYTYMKYVCVKKEDEDKVSSALSKICQEDCTIRIENDVENSQNLIYGIGEQHLEIIVSKLADRYKVSVELETPKIAYKETIEKSSDIDEKYKKQSGGHGQYGHVKMKFEPSGDFNKPYVFEEHIVGGSVPKKYFPAVEKGLQESVKSGPLAGYPVVGVKADLYDGSFHSVDSSEMAFKTATIQAFKEGIMQASPYLLEPIENLRVTVPDSYTGDVMGDLNKRRGRVLGMTPGESGWQVIEAEIPMIELFDYCTKLRSLTGGRGTYEYEFASYDRAPRDVQNGVINN